MPYCPCCGTELSARDLLAEDNVFREDSVPEGQSTFDQIGKSSEPSDETLWDQVDEDGMDLGSLTVTEPDLQPGESWNENDPDQW